MVPQYEVTVDEKTGRKIIGYSENGITYSFLDDPANSDYQRYLLWLEKPDAEEGGIL